ncbi:ABC transporter permease [[Bacillus] enclensis]|jgi:branched-chain amino acid transport system substrate-binding protein|uniref:Amino acid/amide ABC transporter substrate-binding protein, HAAT family n=1 Tax=[Bacillus] enclensis TaxID=1402860 RepID=A0A0V8HHW3_9BACI|nr:substrate-binding domain-containing protein [[Bacillus] enclensis]KSU62165.1 ABC transporter permease [[Bacillus] enclensis]OAT83114.1 ABC transporter permease [Bacillus sp. MKU004]QWC24126.1 substrate-binding domain-containing protein [Bacillus haikouensis]SCC00209.1 amino acid/amide ABC transporter substrate-binding protein, HAAT family [[Bacillus] enclensis]
MKKSMKWPALVMVLSGMLVMSTACNSESSSGSGGGSSDKETVKVGVLASLTGALESYGKQTQRGFELGLEYATDGTMEVAGKKIEVVFEDTETKPEVAVQKATKLLEEDEVDFLVGSSSSGDTLAVLPLAEEYEKIMVVEPAVADSITGSEFNPYIFRTARNSSQDAVAGAAAIAKDGVKIATLAPDYSFGRDGVAAFKGAAEKLGAEIVHEEYADPAATDFTSNIQKVIEAKPDYLFVIWAGANSPWNQIADMKLQDKGIKISTGAPDIAALSAMEPLVGMEGFSVYYHELPDNEINDWLVEEHKKKYDGEVPDLFTPGGMSAAISIVEAIKKTEGDLDPDTLIETMEGMSFETPKGKMTFREEDHQALQTLYAIRLEKKEGVPYPVPVLIRELSPEETAPPIMN